jgi:hypothetical protein
MNRAVFLGLLIFCTGCDDLKKDYPSLHSVPERPTDIKARSFYEKEKQALESSHEMARELNKKVQEQDQMPLDENVLLPREPRL